MNPVWPRVVVLSCGAALLAGYSSLAPFVPDFITLGMLDGARNIAEGRGLVANSITTAFLPYYKDLTLPLPYLWYPLVPVVTSGFFYLFGEHESLVLILPVTTYLLSGLLLLELGRRLFDLRVGILAALALLTQPYMIETAARENFTDPVLVCLLIGSVLATFVASDARTRRPMAWLAVAGVLLGLSQYARSAATMLYPPMTYLVLAADNRQRGSRLAVFLGSCFATQLPLFLWNLEHIGTLTFTPTYVFLFLTPTFPGQRALALVLPKEASELFRLYGREIAYKWASQVWVHYKYFFTATSPVLLVGSIMSVAVPLSAPQRVLRDFTAVLFFTLVALNSLAYWDNRYLLPVMPFVALLGVDFFRQLLTAAPLPGLARAVSVAAVTLLAISPTLDFYFQVWKSTSHFPAMRRANMEWAAFLKSNLRPGDIVMTVNTPHVAWETRHTAVGLPRDLETAATIKDRYVPFNTLILDPAASSVDLFGYSKDWYRVANGEMSFPGFHHEKTVILPSGRVVVLLRETTQSDALR